DIEGNERADTEAKVAAHGQSSPAAHLPPFLCKLLPVSVSKVCQAGLVQLKE
ncbi:hypothetical protein BKA93DRAFT_739920, partial [Sparassis latifolia]